MHTNSTTQTKLSISNPTLDVVTRAPLGPSNGNMWFVHDEKDAEFTTQIYIPSESIPTQIYIPSESIQAPKTQRCPDDFDIETGEHPNLSTNVWRNSTSGEGTYLRDTATTTKPWKDVLRELPMIDGTFVYDMPEFQDWIVSNPAYYKYVGNDKHFAWNSGWASPGGSLERDATAIFFYDTAIAFTCDYLSIEPEPEPNTECTAETATELRDGGLSVIIPLNSSDVERLEHFGAFNVDPTASEYGGWDFCDEQSYLNWWRDHVDRNF